MPLTRFTGIAASLLAASLSACNAPSPTEPSSYHAKLDQNLEKERAEFINKTHNRLSEVDRQIGLMQAKIEAESPYVNEDKRADWKQQLFDLRQERRQLEAELKRAQTASLPEWKAMRGNLGVMMDSLEAAVQQMSYEVRTAFSR
jgi:hypothetical protein